MMEILTPTVIAFVSAVITTLIVQVVSIRNLKKSFQDQYKRIYFEKQMDAYQQLWKELRPLSKWYDENQTIFYLNRKGINNKDALFLPEKALSFCTSITDFFFSEQGIFISKETRKQFFILRSILGDIASNNEEEVILPEVERKKINSSVDSLIMVIRDDLGVMNLRFDFDDLGIKNK